MEDEEQQFRIPKAMVPVVCHTIHNERIEGDVFLDITSVRYDFEQVLEFFNSGTLFFPLRTASLAKPIILFKNSLARVDLPNLLKSFEEDTSVMLAPRKHAILHIDSLGSLEAKVILNLPHDHSRILDLLNIGGTFFPVLLQDELSFINSRHIYKIEEI